MWTDEEVTIPSDWTETVEGGTIQVRTVQPLDFPTHGQAVAVIQDGKVTLKVPRTWFKKPKTQRYRIVVDGIQKGYPNVFLPEFDKAEYERMRKFYPVPKTEKS